MSEPKLHDTIRYVSNRSKGRITYRPDWCLPLPWAAYVNGTATLHFATPEEADEYFKTKYNMERIA